MVGYIYVREYTRRSRIGIGLDIGSDAEELTIEED
jgi:hypothetical protein